MKRLLVLITLVLLSACATSKLATSPVTDFALNKYLGKWYEIARLDHVFERGLSRVSAEYTRKNDGTISVINRGLSAQEGTWKSVEGQAKMASKSNIGHLKVSFFWPFYGDYVIFELDKENYQYAFVSGAKTHYLWLLSRTKIVSPDVKALFIARAKKLGFKTENLIWVSQY